MNTERRYTPAEQQRLDTDALGQMVHQAMVRQVLRDGWAEEAVTRWDSLDDSARGEFHAVAIAVAQVVLEAAAEAVRQEAERVLPAARPTEWPGYRVALRALAASAASIGLEVKP